MSAYRDWYVGMKVVCVDASVSDKYSPPNYRVTVPDMHGLEEGRVYTIRELCKFHGVVAVRLYELVRPATLFGKETPFAAARFRPVQTRKTDISIFTAMLTGQRQKEPAQ